MTPGTTLVLVGRRTALAERRAAQPLRERDVNAPAPSSQAYASCDPPSSSDDLYPSWAYNNSPLPGDDSQAAVGELLARAV